MDFLLRDADVSDLNRCIELLASEWLCEPAQRGDLRAMLQHMIETSSGIGATALDPATNAIIHFGFTLFVSDERAAGYQACERPLIARRILSDWTRGGRPFLSRSEIARANAGDGLNLVVAYYGGAHPGEQPDERRYAANYESSRRVFSGWNVRTHNVEIFREEWRRDAGDWGKSLGFRVAEYTPEQLRRAGIPTDAAPCIWWARREDASTNPGWALTQLFTSYARPRFGFSLAEQELLRLALDGHTDESVARCLSVSIATIKKRFRVVYEKVEGSDSFSSTFMPAFANGVRGTESRRHLLNYLREHPEELRPYDAGAAVVERGGS